MSALLRQHIKPLEKYFKIKGVVELCINEPGEIWIETFNGWVRKSDKTLSLQNLNHFATVLATHSGQKFDDFNPLLATSLPGYGYRIQVVGSALSESGIGITIRIAQAQRFDMETYMSKTDAKELKTAIKVGKTVLVAGGTSSGKTTLLNSMIRYIPMDTRLLVIEDTKELVVDQPNAPRWLKSKSGTDVSKITYSDIINASMRFRPDRILMGELDIQNTVPFLRLLNAGHGGSMATVHADGPEQAIDAIVLNSQLSGLQGGPDLITQYAKKALDIVVFIHRENRRSFKAVAEYI